MFLDFILLLDDEGENGSCADSSGNDCRCGGIDFPDMEETDVGTPNDCLQRCMGNNNCVSFEFHDKSGNSNENFQHAERWFLRT